MTRNELDAALANSEIWAAMRNGRWWKVRRNGATKLWKTRPNDWEIPIKAGLKSCARISQTDWIATLGDNNWRNANFVFAQGGVNPNEARS